MRLARDFGTVEQLLPEGITDLRDAPYPLFDAIRLGSLVLHFEELPEDERPPRRIWTDGEKLNEHFEKVRRDRKRDVERPAIEDPVDNEAAKDLIVAA